MGSEMCIRDSFGIMLLVTMYQMWFSSAPSKVVERAGGVDLG